MSGLVWVSLDSFQTGFNACLDTTPDVLLSYTAHFSQNWGYVSISPMIGGNIFSFAFGRNLDAHAPSNDTLLPTLPVPSENSTTAAIPEDRAHQCLSGRSCYADSLYITMVACAVALGLAVYAGWKDYRNMKAVRRRTPDVRHGEVEHGWEDEQ